MLDLLLSVKDMMAQSIVPHIYYGRPSAEGFMLREEARTKAEAWLGLGLGARLGLGYNAHLLVKKLRITLMSLRMQEELASAMGVNKYDMSSRRPSDIFTMSIFLTRSIQVTSLEYLQEPPGGVVVDGMAYSKAFWGSEYVEKVIHAHCHRMRKDILSALEGVWSLGEEVKSLEQLYSIKKAVDEELFVTTGLHGDEEAFRSVAGIDLLAVLSDPRKIPALPITLVVLYVHIWHLLGLDKFVGWLNGGHWFYATVSHAFETGSVVTLVVDCYAGGAVKFEEKVALSPGEEPLPIDPSFVSSVHFRQVHNYASRLATQHAREEFMSLELLHRLDDLVGFLTALQRLGFMDMPPCLANVDFVSLYGKLCGHSKPFCTLSKEVRNKEHWILVETIAQMLLDKESMFAKALTDASKRNGSREITVKAPRFAEKLTLLHEVSLQPYGERDLNGDRAMFELVQRLVPDFIAELRKKNLFAQEQKGLDESAILDLLHDRLMKLHICA